MSEKRELSRAEAVRLRQRQQIQKRVAHSSDLATRPLPPVTARAGTSFGVSKPIARANTRRRFQSSLSMPGLHVQMPAVSVPRVQGGWRLLSLFLALSLGAALYLAWTLPAFRVVSAGVQGNQRISSEEINAVLNATGQPIFTLRPGDLETRLRLNYPELESARVALELPNTVLVSVVERQPVVVWQINGGYTWIDASGVAFKPSSTVNPLISVVALGSPAPGVPSVDDPLSPVPYVSSDLVRAIRTLAPHVPAGTTLIYDPHYGLGWTDSRGWKAFFGSAPDEMALKWQVYQAMVNSLLQRGISPAFISVQYVNAPYYRMSQ